MVKRIRCRLNMISPSIVRVEFDLASRLVGRVVLVCGRCLDERIHCPVGLSRIGAGLLSRVLSLFVVLERSLSLSPHSSLSPPVRWAHRQVEVSSMRLASLSRHNER